MTQPEESAELWAWARENARRSPRWSEAHWRRVNAVLGYEVGGVEKRKQDPGFRGEDCECGRAARTVSSDDRVRAAAA